VTGLRAALGFLTALGGSRPPSPGALAWFPLVGAALGAALGFVWIGAAELWPPLVAASVVVVADLALTGMLHADGLVDAGDGLLAPMDRERRLAVMATPDAGAFGVAALVVVLGTRAATLASIEPSVVLLAALWAASRLLMAVVAVTVPYARAGGGLASAFLAAGARPVALLWALPLVVLAGTWAMPAGPVVVAGAWLAGAGVVALARRRIGGFTGDVLGAAGLVVETVGLLLAAAAW
jgi:adenosylcobinamide-GDP ribazoletransferase